MPFTSRYNTAMLNSIARDGKLYCLPCSAQVRDIVYNTILFEEKGWKVPYDFNVLRRRAAPLADFDMALQEKGI